MAAVITPNRSYQPAPAVGRPDLRLVPAGPPPRRAGSLPTPADLGLTPAALAAVVLALLIVVGGVIAIGQGRLTSLAGSPPAAAGAATATSGAAGAGTAAATVVVHRGDTMWSIARRLQPNGDVRPLVDRLVASNGGDRLAPGDRLLVPR